MAWPRYFIRERVFPLREATVPLLLELCLRDGDGGGGGGEGRTHGVDWNDGSLCSVGRSGPVLSGPREDNVSSSPREIRREGRKTAREENEEKRLGCEVNVSPKVSFCQVRLVRPRRSERDTPIRPFYLVFSSTTVAYRESFI